MASHLCSSPSYLFHDRQPLSPSVSISSSSYCPSSSNFKVSTFPSPTHVTPQSKPFLQLNHVSLKDPIAPVTQDEDSHDPHAKTPSSSKNSIWVNPNSPRAKQLLRKPSGKRYTPNLVKISQSLNSGNPSEEEVYRILSGLGENIFGRDAVFILNKMVNSNTAPLVLKHFLHKVKPSEDTELILYNVTLKVFRKTRDFGGAEKLFDEMLQRGLKPDNITFSTIINCARMCALPYKAVEWFEKMPGFGCEPDDITCSAMVYAYALTNNVDIALKLYDRAKAEKWKLDAGTFSTLIKMFGTSGNYDECLNVYQDMKDLGVKPNVATYNTLLEAMRRAKRARQAKAIYEEMINNGFTPDMITYASLLRVYVKAQFSEEAVDIYKEMKAKGMVKSTVLYNVLLAMCADVGCIEEGINIFDDMRSAATCKPDSWTFSSLISIYASGGKVSEAEAVLDEMIESGYEPNIFVLTSLVQCYGKAKRTDDVVRIFNQLLDLGIVPDDRFCCCLLNVMTQTPKEELGKLTDCVEKANTKLGSVVKNLVEEHEGDDEDFRMEALELFNSIDDEVKKPFCNCLIDLCVNLNVNAKACILLNLGMKLEIYSGTQSRSQTQWSLHLKTLSLGAALTALQVWINDLSKALEAGEELPPVLGINTGLGKYKASEKGLYSVLEPHLKELDAPFREDHDKAGWFLTTNAEAKSWLESKGSTEVISALNSEVLHVPTMALHH